MERIKKIAKRGELKPATTNIGLVGQKLQKNFQLQLKIKKWLAAIGLERFQSFILPQKQKNKPFRQLQIQADSHKERKWVNTFDDSTLYLFD
jgi:hypothetical protein